MAVGAARPQAPAALRPRLVIGSIRACAFALLRRPTSNAYIEWLAAQRRRAKAAAGGGQASKPQRLASIAAVYHQFPHGWATALAAADITDAELEAARAKLLASRAAGGPTVISPAPTPAERLAALGAEALTAVGIDDRTRARVLRKGFAELPFSRAAAVAHALGGSLGWLAGRDADPGEPAAPDARFNPDALRAAAKHSEVKLEALRARAKLDVSGWRAVMTGKREPTLGQVTRWADALRRDLLLDGDTTQASP